MLLLDLTTVLTVALLLFVGWPNRTRPTDGCSARWTGRLVALVLLSPGLRYFSTLFTFPIRLQLSAWAGSLLRLAGLDVQTEGNVLIRNGISMSVDPACMGLQMTGVSLLVALFLLIWQEKQDQKQVSFGWVMAYGLTAFGLTIVCNLFRIILLVLFGAMPDTWAHELLGLVCVLVYTWLPAWGLARLLIRQFGLPEKKRVAIRPKNARLKQLTFSAGWGIGFVAMGIGIRAFAALSDKSTDDLCHAETFLNYGIGNGAAYHCKTLSNGFVQLTKPGALVYLKPQPDWFSADHNPMTCWRGNGYELRQIRETTLDGHPAYVGELRKKGTTLYTAWWYSNGHVLTISQLTMRGQLLRGETGFVLVNVTVASAQSLPLLLCSHQNTQARALRPMLNP